MASVNYGGTEILISASAEEAALIIDSLKYHNQAEEYRLRHSQEDHRSSEVLDDILTRQLMASLLYVNGVKPLTS